MCKHTVNDFLNGSICVRCDTSEDKQRLLQLCTEAGITRASYSTLSIQKTISLYSVFYVGRDTLDLSVLSEATSKFCNVVPFSSLSSNTSPRRIVIDYSDTITTATLYNGEKTVKSATINRRHGDNPSVHVAAVEVIDKLLAKQVKQPKPKKPAQNGIFKVGDRVVVNDPSPENVHYAHGKHGTIVSLVNQNPNVLAVELDESLALVDPSRFSCDCVGLTKPGHGYYACAKHLVHEQSTKPEVREVKRIAEIGEYVKITSFAFDFIRVGDIVRVSSVNFPDGSAFVRECDLARPSGCKVAPDYEWAIFNHYVVLEGYKPEEPTNA